MQVNYKTISSYEYDAISGQYKKVDKEVEDYSSNSDFTSLLDKLGENETSQNLDTQKSDQSSNSNHSPSAYAQMSNMYAYRFRQNEGELSLRSQSASVHNDLLNQDASEQNSKLLNDLLKAI
ncbi:hypothetical protein [Campylobacter estrildidarum]|uniref:Uncharacterized protein n=1 Tax=Campylobacter estrildidarum TaxID=2510189 RepID=A0A4U7BKN6_9BACT|nr:hypothetical protein [Campylobacter estrildidarum]TKX28567.1 hypothetical protein CQA69_08180 [Campylobacter estrildidarum]